jgi:hypothetical protein
VAPKNTHRHPINTLSTVVSTVRNLHSVADYPQQFPITPFCGNGDKGLLTTSRLVGTDTFGPDANALNPELSESNPGTSPAHRKERDERGTV